MAVIVYPTSGVYPAAGAYPGATEAESASTIPIPLGTRRNNVTVTAPRRNTIDIDYERRNDVVITQIPRR